MRKMILMFNLSLFLYFPLFSQQSGLKISGNPELTGEILARYDANGQLCAAIKIVSEMDGFRYNSNNGIVGDVDDKPGEDLAFISVNERVFKIYHEGYEPLTIILLDHNITLKPQQVWMLRITGDARPAVLTTTILVEPSGASLSIDGDPARGSGPVFPLVKGRHPIQITMNNYQPLDTVIEVSEKSAFFRFTLAEKQDAGLQIMSTPEGADVFLDALKIGRTPVAIYYPEGRYTLKIVKEGYVPVEETFQVKLPKVQKSFILEENVGFLTIRTRFEAKVTINGEEISQLENIKLPPSVVRVRVTQSKAPPLEKQVILKRNDRVVLDLYPVVPTGTIQVAVTPFDAKIKLKGDAGEYYTSTGMKIFDKIPVGQYQINASRQGYDSHSETVQLIEGQKINKSIQLKESVITRPVSQASASSGTMTDQDGNVYKTVRIGTQVWMAENLNVDHYQNGDPIPQVQDPEAWSDLNTGAWCYFKNDPEYGRIYAKLYNWYAVNDPRGLAPKGWHVPTDEEWKQLEIFLGMNQSAADATMWRGTVEGGKLKETGTTHWQSPNTGATNKTGFSALPGGYRGDDGPPFYNLKTYSQFWSSTEKSSSLAWSRYLRYNGSDILREGHPKGGGWSIRCVKY